jgi:formylglycine-generating enzyme required for sulfatase activity
VAITMLRIPAGSFLMGSPPKEQAREDDEGPQHEVKLREFFLAQTPITQAQWKEVADWERVERDLDPYPSRFKGPNRPVEQVSWHEAVEFCRRLSEHSGKRYGLPSEAQWEYACRAGTRTPFHFGKTLTAELANYRATSFYGNGPIGEYRKQTTDLVSFPANAWGLQDMHGNVREWCEDHWHGGYKGAPRDGTAWIDQGASDDATRLLRGGSWYLIPGGCRSACRFGCLPVNRVYNCGVRVCCLPPGSSS